MGVLKEAILGENNQDKKVLEYLKTYKVENMELDKFLSKIIDEWEASEEYKEMLIGKRYYQNKNDILEKKRYRPNRAGVKVEDEKLNNSKESHSYLRKLVKQKSNYIFSKPFNIDSDNKEYADKVMTDYFDKKFKRALKRIGEDAIQTGIAWIQVYYDEEGTLSFKRIPAEQVIPMWRDIDHTELDGVIRIIPERIYQDEKVIDIREVEFYIGPYVYRYIIKENKWEKAKEDNNSNQHFVISIPEVELGEPNEEGIREEKEKVDENGELVYKDIVVSWDRIPFVPFKYNSDEIPLIRFVKSLIDDYDKITSTTSDIIIDVPNSIKVVRNYDGQDLGELAENIYTYRMVKVSDDGNITSLDTDLDITPTVSQLDRIRKDIYDMGQGVDTQNEETGDKSGVALKFLYSDLDLDCNGMITEFKYGLEQLLFFIDVDLEIKGKGDYFDEEVEFVFNTDGIINEKEVIENIKNSMDLLPEELLIRQHPYVDDPIKVMEDLKKEEEEAQKKTEEIFNQGFNNKPHTHDNHNHDKDPNKANKELKEEEVTNISKKE